MRRWLIFLLLVVVQFQYSWVLAAAYCQHESGSAAQHFGHHHHPHHAGAADGDAPLQVPGGGDGDCVACHAGIAGALSGFDWLPASGFGAETISPPAGPLPAPPTAPPERPNWSVSA